MKEIFQDPTVRVLLFLAVIAWMVSGGIMYQWYEWYKQPYEPLTYPIPTLVEDVKTA